MSSPRRWWLPALSTVIALGAVGSWGCCTMHHGPKGPFVVVSQTAAGASVEAEWLRTLPAVEGGERRIVPG